MLFDHYSCSGSNHNSSYGDDCGNNDGPGDNVVMRTTAVTTTATTLTAATRGCGFG